MQQTPVPCGQDFSTVKMEPLSYISCAALEARRYLDCVLCSPMYPLRAGRCESLPHMKYRTEGDISYLLLNLHPLTAGAEVTSSNRN